MILAASLISGAPAPDLPVVSVVKCTTALIAKLFEIEWEITILDRVWSFCAFNFNLKGRRYAYPLGLPGRNGSTQASTSDIDEEICGDVKDGKL